MATIPTHSQRRFPAHLALAWFALAVLTSSVSAEVSPLESRSLGASAPAPLSGQSAAAPDSSFPRWIQTAGALAGVLALIFALKFTVQRASARVGGLGGSIGAAGRAPSGVLEVLGRYPVARGHTLVLLRMDRRILLLGQSSAGFTSLTEVTDPDEVASLVLKTRDEEGESNAAKFNDLLREMERDPSIIAEHTPDGPPHSPAASRRAKLFGKEGMRG